MGTRARLRDLGYALGRFPVGHWNAITDVGGVREMIDEGVTGYLVRIGDSAALAERLVLLLTDDERRRAMGRAARKRVETEFTLSRSIEEAAHAIEETRVSSPTISA